MSTAERIRLPDDCTIGYIVEALLGVPLVRCGLFHSHLENLQQVPASELHEQVRRQGLQAGGEHPGEEGRGRLEGGREWGGGRGGAAALNRSPEARLLVATQAPRSAQQQSRGPSILPLSSAGHLP